MSVFIVAMDLPGISPVYFSSLDYANRYFEMSVDSLRNAGYRIIQKPGSVLNFQPILAPVATNILRTEYFIRNPESGGPQISQIRVHNNITLTQEPLYG